MANSWQQFIDLVVQSFSQMVNFLQPLYNIVDNLLGGTAMYGYSLLELIIALVVVALIFGVLWKVLKFALRTAIVVVLLIFGLYLAFGILGL